MDVRQLDDAVAVESSGNGSVGELDFIDIDTVAVDDTVPHQHEHCRAEYGSCRAESLYATPAEKTGNLTDKVEYDKDIFAKIYRKIREEAPHQREETAVAAVALRKRYNQDESCRENH